MEKQEPALHHAVCGVLSAVHDAPTLLDKQRQRFRDALRASQHPANCALARLCRCRVLHSQLFSALHGEAICLLVAFERGCTLVATSASAAGDALAKPETCNSSTDLLRNCYLQPLSACTAEDGVYSAATPEFTARQALDYTWPIVTSVARMWGLHGPLMLYGELMAHLLRPRPRVRRRVLALAQDLRLGDCDGRIPLDRTLAVHVRLGDKASTRHRALVNATAALARHTSRTLGMEVIHFASDSLRARAEFGARMRELDERERSSGVPIVSVPAAQQIFTGDDNARAASTVQHKRNDSSSDQLELLLAEAVLVAQAGALVGVQVSNVDRALTELMGAVRWPPLTFDVFNDQWVPGAAVEGHNSNAWQGLIK